jgi:hypothetical protein
VVEQDDKVGAFPAVNRLSAAWEGAGWLARLWWVPILALAMAVRFYGLTASAIWADEGSSLLLSEYAMDDLWFHAAHDVHPPLYFFMLRGWIGLFGDGIWSIRGMSAIPGVVAVGLGIALTRQLSTRRAAVLSCWRCFRRQCVTARKCACIRCWPCGCWAPRWRWCIGSVSLNARATWRPIRC